MMPAPEVSIACGSLHPGTALTWQGPGLFAFLGVGANGRAGGRAGGPESRELPAGSATRRVQGIQEILADSGGRQPTLLEETAREFLENGGSSCILLEGPPSAGGRLAGLGEEGAPGQGTGLHALADLEDVGAVAIVGPLSPFEREQVLAFAERRRDLLFFLEERGLEAEESRPALSRLRANSAVLRWRPPAATEAGRRAGDGGLGKLAAYLEASDFRFHEKFRSARAEPPAWLETSVALQLQAWRRRAGLLRSLDLGTRWVLFELNHPFLWRKVEREVRAFLRQLERRGFLAPGEGLAADSVACAGESGEGVVIHVRVQLSDPFGSALTEVLSIRRDVSR